MTLGEKILQSRQEAGLSQRQLCGDVITRNMLSQIEHGTARPSMDTLRYLAGRLGKPMSYFLEEDVVTSSNLSRMQQARAAWQTGDAEKTRQCLLAFQLPDDTFAWEWRYLRAVSALAAAEQAAFREKTVYARQLLEEAAEFTQDLPGLERKRLLQLAGLPEADKIRIAGQLPPLDEELLLRAEAALMQDDAGRASQLLAAVEDRENPRWNLVQGRIFLARKQYAEAASCLEKAENSYPEDCVPLLEICFRELGDFRRAYEYACKQR